MHKKHGSSRILILPLLLLNLLVSTNTAFAHDGDHKVWICHAVPVTAETEDDIVQWLKLYVDAEGWNGHDGHTWDYEVGENEDCPTIPDNGNGEEPPDDGNGETPPTDGNGEEPADGEELALPCPKYIAGTVYYRDGTVIPGDGLYILFDGWLEVPINDTGGYLIEFPKDGAHELEILGWSGDPYYFSESIKSVVITGGDYDGCGYYIKDFHDPPPPSQSFFDNPMNWVLAWGSLVTAYGLVGMFYIHLRRDRFLPER